MNKNTHFPSIPLTSGSQPEERINLVILKMIKKTGKKKKKNISATQN